MSDELLKNADKAGLYCLLPTQRETVEKAADKLHFRTFSVNLSQCRTIDCVLQQLGSQLNFPTWYGNNFDALFDCLTDGDCQAGKGHILLIDGLDSLRLAAPDDFTTLLEVFQAVGDTYRELGAPFWILLDTPAQGIPALPAK